jgi:4-methylaminobutanoate oxidase (formaldehyde-forming)
MGPGSRSLLDRLSIDDFGNESFRFGSSRVVDIGYARVRASRVSYAGELGWELYIPTEFATHVLEHVRGGGASPATPLVGYHALNSLRMEKAYRHWGHDIGTDDTPLEAGLGFAVAWDKPGGFIGRDRLLDIRDAGVDRHLMQFQLSNGDILLHHNEPILRGGQYVGRVTSGAYGHTLERSLGLGYVTLEAGETPSGAESGQGFQIEVAGDLVPAVASVRPAYDPTGSRLRS